MAKLRTGDDVQHRPTGEVWVVAIDEDDNGDIMWCGWPEGWAKASDCTLIKAATDEERLELLIEVSKPSKGICSYKAMNLLKKDKRDGKA